MKHVKFSLFAALLATTIPFTFAEVLTGSTTTGDVTTGSVDTGIVLTGVVSTGNTTTGEMTTGSVTTGVVTTGSIYFSGNVKNGYAKIRGTWKLINEDFGYVKKFFKKPLTGDALSGSKAVISAKNLAIKTLNQEMKATLASSGTVDWSGYAQKFVDVYTTFKAAALPYVASGKEDKFIAYIDAKIAAIQKTLALRQSAVTAKEKAYIKQQEVKKQQAAKKAEQAAKKAAAKAVKAAKKSK